MVSKDKFANMAAIEITESAANTLTFKKLETGVSLFEKIAWIIHRIEYLWPAATHGLFNASGDALEWALCATDQIASLSLKNNAMIDYQYMAQLHIGTAASGFYSFTPRVVDFTSLPMGGVIVPPNPLYVGIKGTSLLGAATMTCRFFYTTYTLSADDYWELVEARRVIVS